MARSTVLFIFILAILAGFLGYNYFVRPFARPNNAVTEPTLQSSPEPEIESSSTDDVIARLSSRQKVAQLIAYPVRVNDAGISTTSAEIILASQPGMVTLFGSTIATSTARQAVSTLKSNFDRINPIRLLVATEHEGGTVQRLSGKGFTRLPAWQTMCELEEVDRKKLQLQAAKELNQVGIDIVFGPVVDLAEANPYLKSRVCSAEADTVINRTTELVKILQSQKILPVVKHFPGIGKTTKDLHVDTDEVMLTPDDVAVFQSVLSAYPEIGVMVSHVVVADQFDQQPCSLASGCVQGLRDTFPQALVFSDALEMQSALNAVESESLTEVAKVAILAGNDILVFSPGGTDEQLGGVIAFLAEEYDQNADLKMRVDASVKKLVEYKMR